MCSHSKPKGGGSKSMTKSKGEVRKSLKLVCYETNEPSEAVIEESLEEWLVDLLINHWWNKRGVVKMPQQKTCSLSSEQGHTSKCKSRG